MEDEIITNKEKAKVLPYQSIIKLGTEPYIFIVEKIDDKTYYFRKEKIKIAYESKEFSKILSSTAIKNVLISGVYNIPFKKIKSYKTILMSNNLIFSFVLYSKIN